MTHLRCLRPEDAPLMLEWMHDPEVVQYMRGHFASKTVEDCRRFIAEAARDTMNIHRAVADEQDIYLGTVSLKNLDKDNGQAEFAICMRRCAHGKGQARAAMQAILQLGFQELNLRRIYWCVDPDNLRARRFYQKQWYQPLTLQPDAQNLLWYEIWQNKETL